MKENGQALELFVIVLFVVLVAWLVGSGLHALIVEIGASL